ncbi:hypothetical protein D3C86_2206940 [compost metagenome]
MEGSYGSGQAAAAIDTQLFGKCSNHDADGSLYEGWAKLAGFIPNDRRESALLYT